jgi:DNA-binding NtrC family response regulator
MADNSSKSAPTSLVVIASPLAGLRKRCRQAIHRTFAVHEVADREDLEKSVADRRPVAVLLDLALPGLGGAHGVASIQKLRTGPKVIVLTAAPTSARASRCSRRARAATAIATSTARCSRRRPTSC